jgi:hypothetical protein
MQLSQKFLIIMLLVDPSKKAPALSVVLEYSAEGKNWKDATWSTSFPSLAHNV